MSIRLESKSGIRRSARHRSVAGVAAALIAVVGFGLGRHGRNVERSSDTAIVAAFDTVDLPVPIDSVPAGARVRDIRFHTLSFPQHQIPAEALQSLESISDSFAVATLPANLPLFQRNFSPVLRGANPVVERIPTGMRAMTVRVDATSAVEGWAGSGSVVDVLLVSKERTSVIAERVKVLSAERMVSPIDGAAAPNVPSTVTLLVSQEQCLAINTAIPLGRIAFALRSMGDDGVWASTALAADQLNTRKSGDEATRGSVTGFLSISQTGGQRRGFVLSDNRWVETAVIPQGFRIAGASSVKEAVDAKN